MEFGLRTRMIPYPFSMSHTRRDFRSSKSLYANKRDFFIKITFCFQYFQTTLFQTKITCMTSANQEPLKPRVIKETKKSKIKASNNDPHQILKPKVIEVFYCIGIYQIRGRNILLLIGSSYTLKL